MVINYVQHANVYLLLATHTRTEMKIVCTIHVNTDHRYWCKCGHVVNAIAVNQCAHFLRIQTRFTSALCTRRFFMIRAVSLVEN